MPSCFQGTDTAISFFSKWPNSNLLPATPPGISFAFSKHNFGNALSLACRVYFMLQLCFDIASQALG